jgi:hypothetical protein
MILTVRQAPHVHTFTHKKLSVSERRRRQTESTVHTFTRFPADFEAAFRISFNRKISQTQVWTSVMDSTGSESGPAVGSSEHGTQPYITGHFLTRLTTYQLFRTGPSL